MKPMADGNDESGEQPRAAGGASPANAPQRLLSVSSPGVPPPEERGSPSDVPAEIPEASGGLVGSLLYGLSLPERTARSVAAMAGGIVHETAARLIPLAFRSSKSYALFVQQSLDMAVHDFGGVAPPVAGADAAASAEEGVLARKAVGGLLDVAGMATLHLSPMTVLAVFSDLAYGSGHYLRQLSVELKHQGVIDQGSSIDNISDLLEALQRTSQHATDALDRPPINVEGLRQTIQQTRDALAGVEPTKLIPQSEIGRIWSEMEATARQSDVGLLDVSATMTLFAMNRLTLVSRGALSSVSVAGNLLDQHIVSHYSDALTDIQTRGIYSTLTDASAPYLEAVWNNFASERATWTEDLLTGRLIGRTWQSVRGWWG